MTRLDLSLVALFLSLVAATIQRTRTAVVSVNPPQPIIMRAPGLPPVRDPGSLREAESMIVENDVFRVSNRPSSVPFTRSPPLNAERSAVASPPRPNLTLRAIMGGPPWLAVLDGLPGRETGAVVRSGESFEKLVIRSIDRDTVVVQAPDTVWKLTISRSK